MLLGHELHILSTSYGPYIVLFHLKLVNEDGNLQVCMYCMHAQKGASAEAPRTHFRACKTSKFSGGMPQGLPCTMYGPYFLYLPWASPILLAPCIWSPSQGFTKFTQLHVVTSQFVMVIPCALCARIEDRTGSRHDLVEVKFHLQLAIVLWIVVL